MGYQSVMEHPPATSFRPPTFGEKADRAQQVAELLIKNKADIHSTVHVKYEFPEFFQFTPLQHAAYHSNLGLVACLLQHDVTKEDVEAAFYYACRQPKDDDEADELTRKAVIAAFLKHKVDPNAKPDGEHTALYWAVTQNQPKIAKRLLDWKANPSARYANGVTLLMKAAMDFNKTMMELLLAAGASWEEQSEHGNNVLQMAAGL